MGELEMQEWDRWARAQLGADWRRRMSVALQRGNARIILSGAARARSGRGVRVYGHMSSRDLDTGAGDWLPGQLTSRMLTLYTLLGGWSS